ncbi:hypothetical protein DSM104443_00598 [Usitatibacter rugosus]|uniref:Uncharacterized protein n=1 Tax=Usitatibacter rugosus TaxID=2732067 RepID=A0A6M4GQC5_9PROT|nr:hypothetical protein [Usitatibacter rugosus]QJR09549.1 hypothetical protein DSM104443_00598 [Usitatibacter rugosus]
MSTKSILDVGQLIDDLRRAADYASCAGLNGDHAITATLRAADEALEKESVPDVVAISKALSDLTRIIAPITLTDLRGGRNPCLAANRRLASFMQGGLALLAIVALVFIGCVMNYLHTEQAAVQSLTELQELRPQLRLTALRKIAEFDGPVSKPPKAIFDKFHQEITELRLINGKLFNTFNDARKATALPLVPGFSWLLPSAMAAEDGRKGDKGKAEGKALSDLPYDGTKPPGPLAPAEICAVDPEGGVQLPENAGGFPAWMKHIIADVSGDNCFYLNVLFPTGNGMLLSDTGTEYARIPALKESMSMRVTWILPFAYGLLGAAIFLMRNITNVRVPAMNPLEAAVRIASGGVAGIVIGWFYSATPGAVMATTLSLPLALAFVAGYGIESLFTLLDRLNRMIAEPLQKPATA